VEHNLPLDTFHDNRNTTIQYVDVATIDRMRPEATKHLRPRRYFLMSYGPDADGRTNFTPPRDHQQFPDLSADEAVLFVGPVSRSTEHLTLGPYTSYDPTNGSISRGDIYHWGIGTGEVGLGPYREQRRQ
jgi:hypothetical protein